jgi:hypothetical protein
LEETDCPPFSKVKMVCPCCAEEFTFIIPEPEEISSIAALFVPSKIEKPVDEKKDFLHPAMTQKVLQNKEFIPDRRKINEAQYIHKLLIVIGFIIPVILVGGLFFFHKPNHENNDAPEIVNESSPDNKSVMNLDVTNRLLTDSDVSKLSKKELRFLRNEIYARHGYIFKVDDLEKYFSSFSWYSPKYENINDKLTERDRKNIALIKKYENDY